ncbi:alpha-1-antitrypsin-like protein GS55-MS [Dendropsophus ebraccatus]|uniref:alpha-1-antitrypsin-like protein GS55-MS n=1 Tax=Dendropsophus ebraccatus TaxID=150705 RepID=UPI003831A34B
MEISRTIPHTPETTPRCCKMKLLIFLCLSQVLLCALVCGHHGGPHDDDHDHLDHHHIESKLLHQIGESNVKFAYKLYNYLATTKPNDNFFFSPLSISIAFSLLSLGAKGKTLSQIREGFGFTPSLMKEENIHEGFHQLLNFINQPKSNLNLNMANALFIDNKVKLHEKFLDGAKNWYQSEAISTDFQKEGEALKEINSYVEKKTNGKIEHLLDDLYPQNILVMVNMVLFKGSWGPPFKGYQIIEDYFHVDKNTVVKMPMMTTTGEYPVVFKPEIGYTIVEVPYKGNTSAMFIIPSEGKLHDIEKALLNVSIASWVGEMRPMEVMITLPRFTLSSELDLLGPLQELGLTDIFSNNADLSGITVESDIKVTKAVHQAMLSVDEEGKEASAATAIGIANISLPPHVKVDKPFIISIQNKDLDTVLFTGRIVNPKK